MSDERKDAGSGLSAQTLVISSLSAVAATLIVSQFWESGTLFFTAMVPIVVALISEALKRPAEKITQVVPVRRTPSGTAVHEEPRRSPPEREDRFGLYEPERPAAGRRWLKLGLITWLVAFLIGATAVTASELAIFGGSVGGGDRKTTYFGGGKETKERKEKPAEDATPAPATPDEQATPVPDEEATPPPDEEATPAPDEEATPAPTATPTPPPATTPPPAEEDPAAP